MSNRYEDSGYDNPITLTEAKKYIVVDHSYHDTMINNMLTDAFETVELVNDRVLSSRTFVLYTDEINNDTYHPHIEIMSSPCTAVSDVASVQDGVYTSISGSYVVEINDAFSRVYLTESYDVDSKVALPIKVSFTAGYSTMPAAIRSIILQYTAFLYENRGDAMVPGIEPPSLIYNKIIQVI